jgi:hypothetical protein
MFASPIITAKTGQVQPEQDIMSEEKREIDNAEIVAEQRKSATADSYIQANQKDSEREVRGPEPEQAASINQNTTQAEDINKDTNGQ